MMSTQMPDKQTDSEREYHESSNIMTLKARVEISNIDTQLLKSRLIKCGLMLVGEWDVSCSTFIYLYMSEGRFNVSYSSNKFSNSSMSLVTQLKLLHIIQLHLGTKSVEADMVNHPPHYNQHPSGVECIEIVEHMSFNLGGAIKYLWRSDHKADAIEDMKKAIWLIEREIKRKKAIDQSMVEPLEIREAMK